MTPLLETGRLVLDPLKVDDAEAMVSVLADPTLYAFTGGVPPSLAALQQRYRVQVRGQSPDHHEVWHNWIVRTRTPSEPIGYVQATVASDGRVADVAWVIGTRWQGRGYAIEAVRAMVGWLDGSGVAAVTAHVHPGHHASARVAARVGLRSTDEVEDGERVWVR